MLPKKIIIKIVSIIIFVGIFILILENCGNCPENEAYSLEYLESEISIGKVSDINNATENNFEKKFFLELNSNNQFFLLTHTGVRQILAFNKIIHCQKNKFLWALKKVNIFASSPLIASGCLNQPEFEFWNNPPVQLDFITVSNIPNVLPAGQNLNNFLQVKKNNIFVDFNTLNTDLNIIFKDTLQPENSELLVKINFDTLPGSYFVNIRTTLEDGTIIDSLGTLRFQ